MTFYHGVDMCSHLCKASLPPYNTKLEEMTARSHLLLKKHAGNNGVKATLLKGKRFIQQIVAHVVNKVKGAEYRDTISTDYENLLETTEAEAKLIHQGTAIDDKEFAGNSVSELIF
jgi:hypothetical protein